MKLKALQEFERIVDSTIGRTRKNGEIFEVSEERAKVLLNANLVEVVEEKIEKVEKVVKEEVKKIENKVKKAPKKAKK